MAEATKSNESTKIWEIQNNDEPSTDDFELISASLYPSCDNGELVSISQSSERGLLSEIGDDGGRDKTVDGREDGIHVIDPLEAFEMIQSEHRLLKDEMAVQNQILRERLSVMEEQERQTTEKIATMNDQLDNLSLELNEKKIHLENLSLELNEKNVQQSETEIQLKYFKESSEKADLLTAKLLEAEDVIKSQNAMLQQNQNDSAAAPVQAPPSLSTDLVDELKKKDETISQLEGTLANLESALGAMHGENLKARNEMQQLSEVNVDLRELVNALQSQNEMDKAEWAALRVDLEQKIQILSDRVAAFENSYSGASFPHQPPVEASTLRHRDSHTHPPLGSAPSVSWVECPRCHLPMAAQGPHPCPSIIDGLD